jgi:hypothetical protein
MSPRAWRSGLEPAELSFRVPHFFHQTRRGIHRIVSLPDRKRVEPRKQLPMSELLGNHASSSAARWRLVRSFTGETQLVGAMTGHQHGFYLGSTSSIRCYDDHRARIPITRVPVSAIPKTPVPVAMMPVGMMVAAIVVMIIAPVRLGVLAER